MQIVKKGNVYIIRTPNKTYTFKTLKGAKNKLLKLKDESVKQKQKQTQRQSVIVNVNTSKARPSVRKAVKAIQPVQTTRLTPAITPFSALEQFSQARPRSYDMIPNEIVQNQIKEIQKSINELREPLLKKIEQDKFDDIFMKQDDLSVSSADTGFGSMDVAMERAGLEPGYRYEETERKKGRPKKINEDRAETITTENIYGEPVPDPRRVREFEITQELERLQGELLLEEEELARLQENKELEEREEEQKKRAIAEKRKETIARKKREEEYAQELGELMKDPDEKPKKGKKGKK
jgi:hypothetical protein